VLGLMESAKEDKASCQNFLRHLKTRGLQGVRLIVSDKSHGLAEFYPGASSQRCAVHFIATSGRCAQHKDARGGGDAEGPLRPGRPPAATAKAALVVAKLREIKPSKAAELVVTGIEETLQYFLRQVQWVCSRISSGLSFAGALVVSVFLISSLHMQGFF